MARIQHSAHMQKHSLHADFHPQKMNLKQILDIPILSRPDPVRRSPAATSDSSSTSTSTCAAGDKTPQCQKDVSSNTIASLPIALGVVIPITAAIILLIFLHRRHTQRLRREDANDKHGSLDFGIDSSGAGKNRNQRKSRFGKKVPNMTVTNLGPEKISRRGRGMSMDMDLGSPYLPPGVQGSNESLHSLSRTIHGDDRYRPATKFFDNSAPSPTYPRSLKGDDASSVYTRSSGRGYRQEVMEQNLIRHAQKMLRSLPPTQRNSLASSPNVPQIQIPGKTSTEMPRKELPTKLASGTLGVNTESDTRDSYMSNGAGFRKSNNYLGSFIHSRDPSADLRAPPTSPSQELASNVYGQTAQSSEDLPASTALLQVEDRKSPPPKANVAMAQAPPVRKDSIKAAAVPSFQANFFDDESDYGDDFRVTVQSSTDLSEVLQPEPKHSSDLAPEMAADESNQGELGAADLGYDVRRLSMGFRPLPPEDPTDNPEQRANRIRSFYKEYFDDSRPAPKKTAGDYYEDYNQEYLNEAAVFDPATGQFVVSSRPFVDPNRRAMTPPPRAPPRFRGSPRHHASMSGSQYMPPGPRAFSSASARLGPSGRNIPKKALPPPTPLRILPTPHMLTEDSFALPIDFAPPSSYRDRAAGRPESPKGGSRPYSPMLPSHLPLASSFTDLQAMPSPHLLRKSGTFTALDFAPPQRFRSADSPGSDAGSIRSNRSAMSAAQLNSIRAGAYRVSRIPKEVVGTKNEISESLRPTWNLRPS